MNTLEKCPFCGAPVEPESCTFECGTSQCGDTDYERDSPCYEAEISKLKKELYEIISTHSGQEYDKIWKDSDRDYWMTSLEAKEYGMIDEVLISNKKPEEKP